YLPALLAGGGETEPRYCEGLREVATAAEKGQIDRALDMYLGSRIGEHWRDGLPKSRLGAIRRAAGNLAPLLTGMIAAPFDRGALERVHAPVTILLGQDAAIDDRTTGDLLVSILPRARIEQIHAHTRALVAGDAEWVPAIARALVANAA
nr:hypothetical protein [Chloroflexia bacterium]